MTFDVCTIGNALVDVLSFEDDDFVVRTGVERGATTLVDHEFSARIYSHMGPAVEASGGSAANTAAGVASFGGSAAYLGRVADDEFGKIFIHDLRGLGVHFDSPIANDGSTTGRCLVIVTSDAQRTMCTYLGAATGFDRSGVDERVIADSAVTYLEGYLWDEPKAKEAMGLAAQVAHANGRRVALTLSDPFCVERHRVDFLALLERDVDLLFANELEITSLYQVDDFEAALARVRGHCEIAALTRGPQGSVIVTGDDVYKVAAAPIEHVIDTTGAGDLYAAGFLYGLTHDYGLERSGELASLAASEVISHLGPRPAVVLAEHAARLLER